MAEKYKHIILLSIIFFISFCVWTKQISIGGLSWSDAPLHAMDGVFIYDFIHAVANGTFEPISLSSVKQWAYQYYAKYPSLGIIVFYPPFFAAIEACVYVLLGISVFAARFSVILFSIVGFWAIYSLARMLFDKTSAILSAGIWATLPATVLWSRTVMLEVPTVAMLLLCTLFYVKYREHNKTYWLILTAIGVIVAFLTKQWAIFISAVFIIDMILHLGFVNTFTRRNVIVAIISSVIIICYIMFSSKYAALSKLLVRGDNWHHLCQLSSWLFYVRALPKIFGIPVLALAVAGLLIAAVNNQLRALRIVIVWAIVFYLFATIISYKEVRYFYLIAPAGVLMASCGISAGLADTKLSWLGRVILMLLFALQAAIGWNESPKRLNDYAKAAEIVIRHSDTNFVLIDATREGQFIFDMRRLQGFNGRMFTMRGSKLLYSRAARKRWRYSEHIKSQKDILQLIRHYAIRYIIVESNPPDVPDWQDYFPPPSQKLRKLLHNKHLFSKIAEFPISGRKDDKIWHNVRLQVFRYRGRLKLELRTIKIPVPSMGQDIEVQIGNFQK